MSSKRFLHLCLVLAILFSGMVTPLFQPSVAVATPPDRPNNVSPLDNATGVSLTPTLVSDNFFDSENLTHTHYASQWQIRIASDNYDGAVFDSGPDNTNLTSIDVPFVDRLDDSTTYYWHVRYQDNTTDWSSYSTEWFFTTMANQPPHQPINQSPADNTTGVSLRPTLMSSAFDDDVWDTHAASRWQITVTSGNYTSSVFDSGPDNTNLTSIVVTALEYSTIYYWHVSYQDNNGLWSDNSAEWSFSTTGALAPTVTTDDPNDIKVKGARLNGSLNDLGTADNATVSFVWGTTAGGPYPNETDNQTLPAIASFFADLSGLDPNTAYYYEAKAVGEGITVYGLEKSFTTVTNPPTVTTGAATGINTTSATLNGNLTSMGTADSVTVSFIWGTTPGGPYPNETAGQPMTSPGTFQFNLGGLVPGTTYYYRAKAVGDGADTGDQVMFSTVVQPAVTTYYATSETFASAQLRGYLTSKGTADSISVSYQWGTTSGTYGNETAAEVKSTIGWFYFDLTDLLPGTTYYYRAKADGDGDPVYGVEKIFTTLTAAPTVTTNDATGMTTTSAQLNGNLLSMGAAVYVSVSFVWGEESGVLDRETTAEVKSNTGTFYFNLTDLFLGTTYYYRAKADGDGDPVYGAEKSFTTYASSSPPDQPSNVSPANAATSVSVTATLQSSAFADPDGDTHAASRWQITSVPAGYYSSPVFDSGVDTVHLTTFDIPPGLVGYSTTYYWRVRYQDHRGNWSAWSTGFSFTTLNREPNQPVNILPANGATAASRTSVLQSSAFSTLFAGDTHIASQWQISATASDYSAPVFDSSTDAENLTSIAISSGVLQYSSTYYWRVRHQDSHRVWSPWSVETSFATATQPHAEFSVTSVRTSDGVISVFFSNLSSGGASPLTCAWDFNNDGNTDTAEWEPWHAYATSGTYAVSLSVTDAWGDIDTETKPNCFTILPREGAIMQTVDGQISTRFPSGAVAGTAVVTIERTATSLLSDAPEGFKTGDTCFVMTALDKRGNEIMTLSQPSTITVKYSEADVAAAGGNPKDLVLAYWDETTGLWETLKTSVDTTNMTLSAFATHIGTYAVLAKTTSASGGLPAWAWLLSGLGAVAVLGLLIYLALPPRHSQEVIG